MSDENDVSRGFSGPSHDDPTWLDEDRYRSARRFTRRVYLPRVVCHATGFFCIASVLVMQAVSGWWWWLLITHSFIWPHFAWYIAYRASDPARAEIRNLLIDSVLGGIWAALMGLNVLPSALIITVMCMNNIGCGGVWLFLRGVSLMLLFCGITLAATAVPLNLETMPSQVWICLPLLIIYPIYYGLVNYRTVVKLAGHKRRLMLMSTRDGMTGIYNRRHWEYLLQGEYDNCRRYQRRSTLILIDIDRFKSINDNYGHDIGDEAIVAITDCLQIELRITDIIGRFGGDEFAIIMTGTPQENAIQAIGRVREHLDEFRLPSAPRMLLRISVGVAEFDGQLSSYREWLKAADTALYKAKNTGRDRTEVAPREICPYSGLSMPKE